LVIGDCRIVSPTNPQLYLMNIMIQIKKNENRDMDVFNPLV
jgi:hypothetical protein